MVALLRSGEHRTCCHPYSHPLHAQSSETVATAKTVDYAYHDNNYSAYFDDSYKPGVQQPPPTPLSLLRSPAHNTYEIGKKNSSTSLGTCQIITNGRHRHNHDSNNIFPAMPLPTPLRLVPEHLNVP